MVFSNVDQMINWHLIILPIYAKELNHFLYLDKKGTCGITFVQWSKDQKSKNEKSF